MKHVARIAGLIISLSLVLSLSAMAQSDSTTRGNRGGGQRRGGGFYDPKTVTTISGTVESIETTSGRGGGPGMLRLVFSVSTEKINVMVAPITYLDEQKIVIKAKDSLKIKGSKMERNGNTMMAAAEITKGKTTWVLRDETGASKWQRNTQSTSTTAPKTN